MALSQALFTGISGLTTHQKSMDNIGNNLANVNTVGFKRGVFEFRTLMEQTFRGGMANDPQTGRGSVNPVSLGLGTQVGSINKNFSQGLIETTGNPKDMAINGNGFYIVKQGTGHAYTRDGSFYIGADGSLMSGNGLYVQGTMALKNSDGSVSIPQDVRLENIVIPLGKTGGASQTSKVEFAGNLDSRQDVSKGLRLFGSTTYPDVNSLQKWMPKEFNGGNPVDKPGVDQTWDSLQKPTYTVPSQDPRIRNGSVSLAAGTTIIDYPAFPVFVTDAYNTVTGQYQKLANPTQYNPNDPAIMTSWTSNNLVPAIKKIDTINGGNVQTSSAMAVKIPALLIKGQQYTTANGRSITINNDNTMPEWVYETYGGNFLDAASTSDNNEALVNGWRGTIFDNGLNTPPTVANIKPPIKDETWPATLETSLEHVMYQKGNTWEKPYANIRNGDEISISFRKGKSKVEATFKYNRPKPPEPFEPQQLLNIEKSHTVKDFLQFLAGGVDDTTSACMAIEPYMFGAPITPDYPNGDINSPSFNKANYDEALKNVTMAKQESNFRAIGGAMGLIQLPPKISTNEYGTDSYDAPLETAGAFSRTGVKRVEYERWNPALNKMEKVESDSFNTSFVSNLGAENAISDIRISYNNIPHDSIYSEEVKYSAPQGGSAIADMTFYDSLGNPKQVKVRLAKVQQESDFTTWRWYADSTDDTDFPWQSDDKGNLISNLNVGTGLIRFDKNGNIVRGSELSELGGITINQINDGVNTPIVIKLLEGLDRDITQDLDFSKLTTSAVANDFALKGQNGAPPGSLEKFMVSLDGVVQGQYTNGVVSPIARLALALIPNENGLVATGDNLFYTGPASGSAQIGFANLGGRGVIQQSALETSNVTLADEFTKMITTERGFQANARTITTSDNMLQELINLKR